MIAKVITGDGREYISVVFAMFGTGWDAAVITYDDANSRYDLTNMYKKSPALKRRVFILDNDETGWVSRGRAKSGGKKIFNDVRGYSWLLDDADLLKRIVDSLEADKDDWKKAGSYNSALNLAEWTYVRTPSDAENLMTAAGGFHDAELHRLAFERADLSSKLEIVFTGCWQSTVTLLFEGDVVAHCVQEDSRIADIFEASVFFNGDDVVWTDCDTTSFSGILEGASYFKGKSLKWKIEIDESF